MPSPTAFPRIRFFDADGAPLAFGYLYTYVAGTTTPLATYTSSTGMVSNTNPIQLDAAGECVMWLGSVSPYDFLLKNAGFVTQPTPGLNVSSLDVLLAAVSQRITDIADGTSSAKGTALVSHYGPYAIPYQKTLSAIINGERFDMLMGLPTAQRSAVQTFTSSYDAGADIASVLSDMNTAKRGDLYFSDGLYNVGAAITTLGKYQRLSGSTRRGFGGPGTYRGSVLKATTNTGVFNLTLGALAPTDIEIEHLYIIGSNAGTADGLTFTNCAGVDIRDCVVSQFGRHNIYFTGSGAYNLECQRVYSSLAGDSCFYIDGSDSVLERCQTDGGLYSVYATANSGNLSIGGGSHFEGASTLGLKSLGTRLRVSDALFRMTVASSGGVELNAARSGLSNVDIFGNAAATFGLDVKSTAIEWRLNGLNVNSFDTAARLAEGGLSAMAGCTLEGITTGLELIGGTYVGVISGNAISGSTNSIKHTSGNGKWIVGPNRLDDAAGAYKAMTVTAGTPLIQGLFPENEFLLTYGTTISLDAQAGGRFLVVANNGTNFAIAAPTNPSFSQEITIIVSNTSGGALGTITWNAAYKKPTFTAPATGFRRWIKFRFDGTSWYECGMSSADIPN